MDYLLGIVAVNQEDGCPLGKLNGRMPLEHSALYSAVPFSLLRL